MIFETLRAQSLGKKIITRAKLIANQRIGLPLISRVKLEVSVGSRVLKLKTRET